jgi:Flp pilus assembly pilin Flp
MKKLLRFLKDEEGAVAVEYSLIAALIVVVIMTALISIV